MKLLFAERRECGKALALARRIDREYAEAAKKRQAEQRTFQTPDFRPGDPAAAYYAHLETIRRHLTIEDYSRGNAMTILSGVSAGKRVLVLCGVASGVPEHARPLDGPENAVLYDPASV